MTTAEVVISGVVIEVSGQGHGANDLPGVITGGVCDISIGPWKAETGLELRVKKRD